MTAPNKKTVYDAAEFIARIRAFVHQGYGFIPMIGSGMSAPSGILMGKDFSDFLSYTMYLVLCPPDERVLQGTSITRRQWNIRTDGWPNYPTQTQMEIVREWLREKFRDTCKNHGFDIIVDDQGRIARVSEDGAVSPQQASASELISTLSKPFVPMLFRTTHTTAAESVSRRLLKALGRSGQVRSIPATAGYSATSQLYVTEEGLCSLYDWRATLEFLSRVDLVPADKHGRRKLILKEPDAAVVDSFNIHITRGKRHNLGHKMLAHLSRPLRIRTVLTTNFDNLIEEAFERILRSLAVLSVSIKGNLPDPKTVRAQNCIVHLHGEFLETRADFSLDGEPSPQDKRYFAQYFLGSGKILGEVDQSLNAVVPSHLLVLGYSASDYRCNQLVKYLLDSDPVVRVFWLCFDENDVNTVESTFPEDEYGARILLHKTDRPDLLLYELYQYLTLCLPGGGFAYEFTHNVPPQKYPTAKPSISERRVNDLRNALDTRVNKDILVLSEELCAGEVDRQHSAKLHARQAISEELAELVVKAIRDGAVPKTEKGMADFAGIFSCPPNKSPNEKLNAFVVDVASGAASSLQIAFQSLKTKHHKNCIWLELQDYSDVRTLLQSVFQIIALQIGRYQLEQVTLLPDVETLRSSVEIEAADRENEPYKTDCEILGEHFKSLMRYFNQDAKQWVLFLYGRDGPGACAGWSNHMWDKVEHSKLDLVINVLSQVGFKVIYAPLTPQRIKRENEKNDTILAKVDEVCAFYNMPSAAQDAPDNFKELVKEGSEFVTDSQFPFPESCGHVKSGPEFPRLSELSTYEDLIDRVKQQWICVPREERAKYEDDKEKEYEYKIRFLYTLTLFRQSRHPSAFFSDAVYSCPHIFNISSIDNDWLRGYTVQKWVAELGRMHILYRKDGGYSWKHRDVRLGLQKLFQKLPLFMFPPDKPRDDSSDDTAKPLFPYQFLLEARSRYHYWISDWYFKAFAATGHSIPVIEALYHGFQSAKYASLARPSRSTQRDAKPGGSTQGDPKEDNVSFYRLWRFRSALHSMTKLLLLARSWMKFWLAGPYGHPMFDESDQCKQDLIKFLERIYDPASANDKFNRLFQSSMACIHEFDKARLDLGRELREESTAAPRVDSLSSHALGTGSPASAIRIDFDWEIVGSDTHRNGGIKEWSQQFRDECQKLDCEPICRAFDSFDKNLDEALRKPNTPANLRDTISKRLHIDLEKWHGMAVKVNDGNGWLLQHHDNEQATFLLADALSSFAALHRKRGLLEADLFEAKAFANIGPDQISDARHHNCSLWIKTCALCSTGLNLLRHIGSAWLLDEMRLRYKLHTMYAFALGRLGRYYEAHRHLNEAMALLSKSSHPLYECIMAIIRLTRADVFLAEASELKGLLEEECSIRAHINKINDNLGREKDPSRQEVLKSDLEAERKRYVVDGCPGFHYVPTVFTSQDERKLSASNVSFNPIAFEFYRGINFSLKKEDRVKLEDSKRAEIIAQLDRRHTACIDDAFNECEIARELLSGKSQSAHWWGNYLVTILRLYGSHSTKAEHTSLVYRRQIEHGAHIRELLQRGLIAFPNDPYERLRLIHAFLEAMSALIENKITTRDDIYDAKVLVDEAQKRNKSLLSSTNPTHKVKQYYFAVEEIRESVLEPKKLELAVL